MNLGMKLWVMIVVLLIVVAVAIAFATPEDRFAGGDCDGSDYNLVTNNVIPQPPSRGTVIIIR